MDLFDAPCFHVFINTSSDAIDKTIIVWKYSAESSTWVPLRSLVEHSHFVSDVVISSDGQFALSGSWDRTLRLWNIGT